MKGEVIEDIQMRGSTLCVVFADGRELMVNDQAQSCCEHRYMTCDDELTGYIGARFLGLEVLAAPSPTDEDLEVHDVQFLHVRTSVGTLTCQTHNEHNGYYGGFDVVANIAGNDVTAAVMLQNNAAQDNAAEGA